MVLAFLLNAFFYLSNISKNISLLLTSSVMAASYFTSNHYIDLSSTYYMYISWIAYDVVTIGLILLLSRIVKQNLCIAAKYTIFGLTLNAILCLLIHIDLRVLDNREPWWFWYFYTLAINTIDVIMVAALILDRDFLGVKFIRHSIKKYFSKKQRTISI
jgi:hypothetical protein